MTLDLLKSEALKLGKSELFDFAQFIIGALKEKDSQTAFHLSRAQTVELTQRLKDVQENPSAFVSGVKAEEAAWEELMSFLDQRIAHAENGGVSTKTPNQIAEEVLRRP